MKIAMPSLVLVFLVVPLRADPPVSATIAAQQLRRDDISYADRRYFAGVLAYAQGQTQEAMNDWTVYRELKSREIGFHPDERWNDVSRLFAAAPRVAPAAVPNAAVQKLITGPGFRAEKPRRKKRTTLEIRTPLSSPVKTGRRASATTVRRLEEKAKRAYVSGQLDDALRYYKLAQAMAPDSTVIQEKVKQIESELR